LPFVFRPATFVALLDTLVVKIYLTRLHCLLLLLARLSMRRHDSMTRGLLVNPTLADGLLVFGITSSVVKELVDRSS
jgi:hypothetical protein